MIGTSTLGRPKRATHTGDGGAESGNHYQQLPDPDTHIIIAEEPEEVNYAYTADKRSLGEEKVRRWSDSASKPG